MWLKPMGNITSQHLTGDISVWLAASRVSIEGLTLSTSHNIINDGDTTKWPLVGCVQPIARGAKCVTARNSAVAPCRHRAYHFILKGPIRDRKRTNCCKVVLRRHVYGGMLLNLLLLVWRHYMAFPVATWESGGGIVLFTFLSCHTRGTWTKRLQQKAHQL